MKKINIFIGTKAQFIKVAPLLQELKRQSLPYRLIDSGQHKDITADLRVLFDLPEPDAYLNTSVTNINSLPRAMAWTIKTLIALLFSKKKIFNTLFNADSDGICLIHGDTLSTLLGLLIAKRCGLKVGHLEAGLRSFDLFNPFPEELIRLICMKWSDYLFAPSSWATDNLAAMKVRGEIYNCTSNTIIDALRFIQSRQEKDFKIPSSPYAIISIHRFENIYRYKRLQHVIAIAQQAAQVHPVVFIQHQPTKRQLHRRNLEPQLHTARITTTSLAGYDHFVHLLSGAEFVITDGGSIQEECYYLNKPCLLLRKKTERLYGIGENVCLSQFDTEKINHFLSHYSQFMRQTSNDNMNPSRMLVDFLKGITATSHA